MQQSKTISSGQFILNLAASLSLTAALIHAMVMPEHFREWWGYGFFFLIVALAQAVYGAALMMLALRMPSFGALDNLREHWTPAFYVAGIVGNIAILVLYIMTRTAGIPIGPAAGEIEPLSILSVVSKMLELALAGCLVPLLVETRRRTTEPQAVTKEQ